MKIYFITQDEPFYLPAFFEYFFSRNNHEILGITILKPDAPKQGKLKFIWEHFQFFGFANFLIYSFAFVFYKIMAKISRIFNIKTRYSVRNVVLNYKVPLYSAIHINEPDFLKFLQKIKPDVIVSVASSQVFKKDILSIPSIGCVNVHGAPLPKYRGKMPGFWALANGEKETAVTVHYMDEKLDNGPIILQRPVIIDDNDTLDSLLKKSKRIAAEALNEALDQIEKGTEQIQENDASQATYFSFPTKQDVRKFLARGRKFR